MDARRGKVFSKLIREITVVAKEGGGDPSVNLRLKNVIDKARQSNMPSDNIERAIRRGTGEDADAAAFEEITYEGYGPASVAVLIEALTDNKNRTAAEIRHIFTKSGGKLSGSGSVAFLFTRKGLIQIPKGKVEEETLYEAAIEAGAENIEDSGETYDVYMEYTDFDAVRTALRKAGLPMDNAELVMVPSTTVRVSGKDAQSTLRMIEMFEDHEDVQNVWANFDIDVEEMEAYQG